MRSGHLFAGGGGGLYADLILGHTPVFAVEWDPYACAVLRSRSADGWFPGLRVHEGDVRLWDPSEYAGAVDCIHAGFPCQDISAAGKGVGITGERSGLYSEVMRAIDAIRPTWVMLENSPLIRIRGRHIVIADLVARGYSWRDGILSASDVGAPHKRDRWWCLAHANGDPSQSRRPGDAHERTGGRDARGGIERENVANAGGVRRQWRKGNSERDRTDRENAGRAQSDHGFIPENEGDRPGVVADSTGPRFAFRESGQSGEIRHETRGPQPERLDLEVADPERHGLQGPIHPEPREGAAPLGRRPTHEDWWSTEPDVKIMVRRQAWCLGMTAGGFPRHPSRLRADLDLEPFLWNLL